MKELKVLEVVPWGDVTNSYSWGSVAVKFQNGRVQKNRKRVHATRTVSFRVAGTEKMWDYLRNFYNSHRGCLDSFYFDYGGERLQCRFAEKVTLIQKRELRNVVAFEAGVSLLVTNVKATMLPLPQVERFDFPILGKIEDEVDWNTRKLDMNIQARAETWQVPIHRFSFLLSGLKGERDKLIAMYNAYGDFVPMEFATNGELYKCFFPGTLEIVDKREGQMIIGYTAKVTLTSTNEVADIVAVKNSYAFLIGAQQSFWMAHPWVFLLGKSWGSAGLSKPFAVIVGKEPGHFMVSQLKAVLLGKEL